MKKLTKEEFSQAKRWLIVFRNIDRVARKLNRSPKTVTQIKHSATYADYTEQNKRQHPITEYSLAERVQDLHRLTFYAPSVAYVKKPAHQCIEELIKYEQEQL